MEFNYESGLGRPDLVIKDKKKRRAVIMEMKIADSLENMKKAGERASKQIEEMCYAGVSKSDKVWSRILSKELFSRQM